MTEGFVHPDVAALLELQTDDAEIYSIERSLADLAPRVEALAKARERGLATLVQARHELDLEERRYRELQSRVAQHRQLHERHQAQLDLISNARQATAAMAQLDQARRMIADVERELDAMSRRVSEMRRTVEERERAVQALEREQEAARASLESDRAALEQRLREAQERRDFARILVGTTARLYGELEGHLGDPLKERIIGRFDAGADWESPQDVREKVEPHLQMDETHREADALAKAAHPGVRGLAQTLPALYERRVDTLLVEPGLEHPGVVCPRCRWAAAEERGACPVDGETMVPHPNLVEWAVGRAIEGDATVMPLRRHNDLADYDGVGAVLRF